jgi:hypothetical protein
MTVDQVINGLKDGSVVFYNINTARNNWNKVEMTKGTTGLVLQFCRWCLFCR